LIAAMFSSVCDATWPTTSPVTSACARAARAIASAIRIIRRR
jgi:3-oxoacyl-(acyl-carrier-protein) synthase